MKISLHTIKQLGGLSSDFEVTTELEGLVARINQRLGAVEGLTDLSNVYRGAVIVKIVSCLPHPNADRLTVCLIDDGGVTSMIERNENGLIQVVCGAPNARNELKTVWLKPGSIVPSSLTDKEPFVLNSRQLRGELSHGMLAAADELGIGSDHGGIIEMDDKTEIGAGFGASTGLDDTTIDIENKMFTHRPDCFGQLGVARELAGIYGRSFSSPKWYVEEPTYNPAATDYLEELQLITKNSAPEKVSRLMTAVITGVKIGPSPLWLQAELTRLGSKPINNIVDITNYMMLISAQPIHAYDMNQLTGATLEARMARSDETITLLNKKTYSLNPADIVISDSDKVIGLAGVMGGIESEVSAETSNIVLEVATFNMYAIRRTSMRHGLFTDAVTRFNKGQSARQNSTVLAETIRLIEEVSGGILHTAPYDSGAQTTSETLNVSVQTINSRLGLKLRPEAMATLLTNVEFNIEISQDTLHITVPFWRTDIEIAEDIIEEVGRLHGFDSIPRILPLRTIQPVARSIRALTTERLRDSFSAAGANELLSFSFVPEKILVSAKQDPKQAFELANALSPELKFYRLSVLPSLLSMVHQNHKMGYQDFVLYEIGKGHNKAHHRDDDEGLPSELEFVDFVYSSNKKNSESDGAAFYQIRRVMDHLAQSFKTKFVYTPADTSMNYSVTAPFDLARSSMVTTSDGMFIGMIGELKPEVIKKFKLPDYVSAATLDLGGFVSLMKQDKIVYTPPSVYPHAERDVCFQLLGRTTYGELTQSIDESLQRSLDDISVDYQLIDIFEPVNSTTKNVTLRFTLTPHQSTLSSDQANQTLQRMTELVIGQIGGSIV